MSVRKTRARERRERRTYGDRDEAQGEGRAQDLARRDKGDQVQLAVVLGVDALGPVGAHALGEDGAAGRAEHLPARERVGEAVEEAEEERLVGQGGGDRDDEEGEEGRVEGPHKVDVGRRACGGVGVLVERHRDAARECAHVGRLDRCRRT